MDSFLDGLTEEARDALARRDEATAERTARSVLKLDSNRAGALRVLAEVLRRRGRAREAAVLLEEAVGRGVQSPDLIVDLADHLEAADHMGRAREWLRRGASAFPASAGVHVALGRRLARDGQLAEAIAILSRAGVAAPEDPAPVFELGRCLYRQGDITLAEAAFGRVLELAPDHAPAMTNLGVLHRRLGVLSSAIGWHERALAADPEFVEAHWNLALALLADGQWQRGFAEYEWRCRLPRRRPPARPLPEWLGGDRLTGRSILISVEQGVGDTLQFIRHAADLKARGACRVVAEAHPGTETLLATVPGIDQVVSCGAVDAATADCYVPVMSLPHRLGLERPVETPAPYLAVPEGAPRLDDLLLDRGPRPRPVVGLVWAGNPAHEDDALRSAALRALRPLWSDDDVRWVSLQVGSARGQLGEDRDTAHILDLAPHLTDYAATAAALRCLDAVVAVDTSVVHLAGALGRPCLVLLNFHGDWRWPRADGASQWYSSVNCLRRSRGESWEQLSARARNALRDRLTAAGGAEIHASRT